MFVILDQAEELFLYDSDGFVEQFPELVNRRTCAVNVLLSVRDDALSRLDVFKARIPDVLGNYLRLDRLSRDAGRDAIVKPVQSWSALANGAGAVEVEQALVEAVLDEVGAGRIDPGLGGRGAAEDLAGSGIETPYLQLVMQRIWDEERAAGSRLLRLETFERLGGAHRIVAEHLQGAIDALTARERDIAARLFNHLVTPSGTKVAHGVSDLAEYAGVSVDELRPVLARLTDGRILRTVARDERGEPRYEIFHDVLAGAVLGWRTQHDADRILEGERAEARRRHRRLGIVALAALVALAAMTALAAYAFTLRGEARASATDARASALQAHSATQLGTDRSSPCSSPGRPRVFAQLPQPRTPFAARYGARTCEKLRRSERRSQTSLPCRMAGSRSRSTTGGSSKRRPGRPRDTRQRRFEGRSWLTDTHALTLRGRQLTVLALEGADGKRTIGVPAGTRYATASPLGDRVLVAGRRGASVLDSNGLLLANLPHPAMVQRAAFNPAGTLVATAGADGDARVWRVSGKLLHVLGGHRGRVFDVAFSRLSSFLVTAGSDGTARVWRPLAGTEVATMPGHGNFVTRARFVANEDSLVTTSADAIARTWKADVGSLRIAFAGHAGEVGAAALVDRDRLVTGGQDGTLRLWKANLASELQPAPGRPAPMPTIDPRATIEGDTVQLRLDGRTVELKGHTGEVVTVEVSADGSRVVTASKDRTARVWDAATGELLRVLSGHSGAVFDASFSPDGNWVVTAGPTTAGVWLIETGERFYFLRRHSPPLRAAAFETQTRIVTGAADGVKAYECEVCRAPPELVTLADERLRGTGRVLTPTERARFGL